MQTMRLPPHHEDDQSISFLSDSFQLRQKKENNTRKPSKKDCWASASSRPTSYAREAQESIKKVIFFLKNKVARRSPAYSQKFDDKDDLIIVENS